MSRQLLFICRCGWSARSGQTLETGRGLVGDRYYEGDGTFSEKLRNTSDWEITLIEREEIERFSQLE